MARVASFHLVRSSHVVTAMARMATDRPRLSRTAGLGFWRLLGTGRGADTGPSADLHRTALFAVWHSADALDTFMADSAIARRWAQADEAWHVRLRAIGGHGAWRQTDVLEGLERGDDGGPIAIVTRADVRWRALRRFRQAGPAVSAELRQTDGLLAVVGIGELPVARLGTFSLWRGLADVTAFSVGRPHHREVVRRTRDEGWYGEELFARFQPYASSGSWDGADPLAP